jgi:hypothetical protein
MKIIGFFDGEEEKEIKELVRNLKRNLEWTGSGSMFVMYDKEQDHYEIYLLRGFVKLNKKEKRGLSGAKR